MDYIDREELILELKTTELRSYFNLGLIDDADLYPTIDNCLSILKCKTKVYKSTVLDVKGFKAKLPEDFHKLKFILKCDTYDVKLLDNYGSQQIEYVPVTCDLRPCQEPFIGCSGNKYYLDQKFTFTTLRLNDIEPIQIVKANSSCSRDFLNQIGNSKGTIANGYLHLESDRETSIYIEYESTDNDGLVPDHPKIRKAIKDILIYNSFRVMWNNGEQDVQSKMQYNERFATIAEDILKSFSKGNEIKDFINMKNGFTRRYNVLEQMSHVRYSKHRQDYYNGSTTLKHSF